MILLILTIAAGAVASYFGPWWAIVPVTLVLSYKIGSSSKETFWFSAFGAALLWLSYAAYLHLSAEVDLVGPMAQLFLGTEYKPSSISSNVLILSVIGVLAAVLGGLGGLSGFKLQKLIRKGY